MNNSLKITLKKAGIKTRHLAMLYSLTKCTTFTSTIISARKYKTMQYIFSCQILLIMWDALIYLRGKSRNMTSTPFMNKRGISQTMNSASFVF